MPNKKISQLDPGGAPLSDDLFVVARGNDNKKITLGDLNIIELSYEDLRDLKYGTNWNNNNPQLHKLIKGQWYYIWDKQIYIRAFSDFELESSAFYRRHTISRGTITILSGTTGTILALNVVNQNILPFQIPFIDINDAVSKMQDAINANPTTPVFKAVARGGVLDLYSTTDLGTIPSDTPVSGEADGDIVFGNEVGMHSKNDVLIPVKYEFEIDSMSGIEHMGFEGTEVFHDQVGVQTVVDGSEENTNGEMQNLIYRVMDYNQKLEFRGTLQGFREDYKEGYGAEIFISCWRNDTESYTLKVHGKIFKVDVENFYSLQSASAAMGPRTAFGGFGTEDSNTAFFQGAGNVYQFVANFNGWVLLITTGNGEIQINVGSAAHYTSTWDEDLQDYVISTEYKYKANWLLTYDLKLLNNNF
ncbi:MAG TPA: hypothetical protein VFF27_00530 [Bacteroidia bacterium]|jgi:hypothetical protein|nr:hypothetical protein [Bacteroidia bacterium]